MTNLIKYNAARIALAEAHSGQKLPRLPGVYAFYANGECMYVGESKNIKKRISTHERRQQLASCEVRFFVCDDRKAIEAKLIRELKPKRNGRSVEREKLMELAAKRAAKNTDFLGFNEIFGPIFGDAFAGGAA